MNFLTGAAAGIATNEAQKHLDKHVHGERDNESFFQKLCDLHDDIRTIATYYRMLNEKPINTILSVPPLPATVKLPIYGRLHSYIFVPNSTTSFTLSVPGVGTFNFTPALGWTQLDLPHNADISLTSGSQPLNILLRCMNYTMN